MGWVGEGVTGRSGKEICLLCLLDQGMHLQGMRGGKTEWQLCACCEVHLLWDRRWMGTGVKLGGRTPG